MDASTVAPAPLTGAEGIKRSSAHLRGSLAAELDGEAERFSGDAEVLLKFHGIYQQDDRDVRRQRTQAKQPLAYSCMVRAAIPGGVVTPEQWLTFDALADEVGGGAFRLTTRQGVQWHTVPKDSLRPLVGTLMSRLVTTLGACGDVVRNVCACPAPDERRATLEPLAAELARRFRPRTKAYFEVFVDGETAVTAEAPGEEPLYGEVYLPRKFKIAIAWPGDNCVDVLTNDVGLVPAQRDGRDGFVIFVGGGLGMGHAELTTYPRLASPLAWAPADEVVDVVEAVVVVQRDHGDRTDRKKARLKYLLDARGLGWFRERVEEHLGRRLADPIAVAPWGLDDHLGARPQGDGRWSYGVRVESGRVRDTDAVRLRSALRAVVEQVLPGIRITARQDVLLTDLTSDDVATIEAVLAEHQVPVADALHPVDRHAIACPALPTCGQALSEAERVLDSVTGSVKVALGRAGVADGAVHLRMTGCPNGCARPYTAELGIVGRTKSTYDVYVGGSVEGTRLAERLVQGVKLAELPAVLEPALERWRNEAEPGEGFGDFCARVAIAPGEPERGPA